MFVGRHRRWQRLSRLCEAGAELVGIQFTELGSPLSVSGNRNVEQRRELWRSFKYKGMDRTAITTQQLRFDRKSNREPDTTQDKIQDVRQRGREWLEREVESSSSHHIHFLTA